MLELAVRIEASSIPEPNSGCWLWLGSINDSGHGRLKVGGKTTPAHRASWRAFRGDPGKLYVCHRCDNPCCVNPEHLFLGTCADNHADRDAKGRQAFGEKNGRAELSMEAVLLIRDSALSMRKLASLFEISRSQVQRIKSRQNWRHLGRL